MNLNTLKKICYVLSFVSITLFLIFFAQTSWKEIDNIQLRIFGTAFWLYLCVVNGITHGKLLSKLQ